MIDRLRKFVKLESNRRTNGDICYEGYLVIGTDVKFNREYVEKNGIDKVEKAASDYIYKTIESRCLEDGITDDFLREVYLKGYMDAINGKPDYPPLAHKMFPEDTDEEF